MWTQILNNSYVKTINLPLGPGGPENPCSPGGPENPRSPGGPENPRGPGGPIW